MDTKTTIDDLGQIRGSPMPMMIYGTAWKQENAGDLVYRAIRAGFRGIDSGVDENYNEPGVGQGILRALNDGPNHLKREALYIQTKFNIDDKRFADEKKYPTLESKITASVVQSLDDLSAGNDINPYIDCLLIHEAQKVRSPDILEKIASALKPFVPQNVRSIGVCNVALKDLEFFEKKGFVPAVVQNQFSIYGHDEFDAKVRLWCRKKNYPNWDPDVIQFDGPNRLKWQKGHRVAYQAFHTLTSNKMVWQNAPFVNKLADLHVKVQNINIWHSLLMSDGIVTLNGTTDPSHMKADVADHKKIARWRAIHDGDGSIWSKFQAAFLDAISGDPMDDDDDVEEKVSS